MEKQFDIFKYWLSVLIVYLVIVLAIAAAGCKTKDKEKTKLNEKLEFKQVESYTVTTILDTTIKVPGAVVSASEPLTQIVTGDTLTAEENGISIEIYYNQATKMLHAKAETKPKDIPVNYKQVKTGDVITTGKYQKKETVKKLEVKSDVGGNIQLFIILAIVGAVIAFGLWLWWKLSRVPPINIT